MRHGGGRGTNRSDIILNTDSRKKNVSTTRGKHTNHLLLYCTWRDRNQPENK